jgi:predicted glycosyltransferase
MKVLIDIVHPADVLFFLNPIRRLNDAGHQTILASREKDVTLALLDAHGLPHRPISRAGRGLAGLAVELVRRDTALIRLVARERPDVLTGFGGTSAAHAGFALRKPAVIFYDSDTATLQTLITYPFVTELHVPTWYEGNVPVRRTHRFAGLKELSYLHPEVFRPSLERAIANGLDATRNNFLIRLVGWHASHDAGKQGWSDEALAATVDLLAKHGRVHISSERPLPEGLAPLRYRGRVEDVHHLLAHCRIYVGESATMAAESCVLGVPAIFAAPFPLAYIKALERRNLLRFVPRADGHAVKDAITILLATPLEAFRAAHAQFIGDSIDVAGYVTRTLINSGLRTRLNKGPSSDSGRT